MRLFVYRPGQPREVIEVELPEAPSLDDLHGVLDGLIGREWEHLSLEFSGQRGWDAFVATRQQDLKINHEATKIYRAAWTSRHPGSEHEALPAIYGTAVIPDRRIWPV